MKLSYLFLRLKIGLIWSKMSKNLHLFSISSYNKSKTDTRLPVVLNACKYWALLIIGSKLRLNKLQEWILVGKMTGVWKILKTSHTYSKLKARYISSWWHHSLTGAVIWCISVTSTQGLTFEVQKQDHDRWEAHEWFFIIENFFITYILASHIRWKLANLLPIH
jgi:hypothetical protein